MTNTLFLILSGIPFLAISQTAISSYTTPAHKVVNNLIINTRTNETTLINDVTIENSRNKKYLNTELRKSQHLKNSQSISSIHSYELDRMLIKIRPIKDFEQTLQELQELNLSLKIDN